MKITKDVLTDVGEIMLKLLSACWERKYHIKIEAGRKDGAKRTVCQKCCCFFPLCPTDSFTDTSIGSNRVNGEHKEKILQRWEGGDSNGENYDLDNDTVSLLNTHQCTWGMMWMFILKN